LKIILKICFRFSRPYSYFMEWTTWRIT